MRGRLPLHLAVLSAALGLPATGASEPAAAPLVSDSAAQLKALKQEGAPGRDAIGQGKLRDSLPAFEPPSPQSTPLPPPRTPQPEAGKSPSAPGTGENWLLDGYTNAGSRGNARSGRAASAPENPNRPRSERTAREAEEQAENLRRSLAGSRSGPANATDAAMAPLMRQWLAGSPVRDIAFDAWRGHPTGTADRGAAEFFQDPNDGSGAIPAGDPRRFLSASTANAPAGAVAAGSAAAKANPYLEALANPSAGAVRPTAAPPAQAGGSAPPTTTTGGLSAPAKTASVAPIPEPPRTKPAPPPSPEDNKKYFPQLKRF